MPPPEKNPTQTVATRLAVYYDSRLVVDFNYAYNPYCAYNPNWSCPIPPSENRLTVSITAGEKTYGDAEGH